MKTWLTLLALPPIAWAQCPDTPSPHFDCASAGGNTHITLFADAELHWDRFDVPVGGSLDITSSGGIFASKHLTSGFFQSNINGPITADGPLTLVNTAGIRIGPDGSLTAPSLTLSTLPAIGGNSYQGWNRSGQLIVSGDLTATSGNATLLGYQTTLNGSVTAPSGKVTLISSGSEIISGPHFQRSPGGPPPALPARTSTRGTIQAPVIEIYSEGFLQNSGRIEGGQVLLEAASIAHDKRPGSIIITPDLTLIPDVLLEGQLIDPNDGNNPGGISTTLGLPNLATGSFTGTQKTTLLPTQFSASNLSRSRIPSAVSQKAKASASNKVASRGTTPAKAKKSVKKSSFFGIVTTKK